MKLHNSLLLSDFFKIPNGSTLNTQGEISYHASLTPPWKSIQDWNSLCVSVGFGLPTKMVSADHILPENSINNHIYKPLFYANNDSTLHIHVASRDVLFHTLRSYAKVLAHQNIQKPIKLNIDFDMRHYSEYISRWKIHPRVFIGRCESMLGFLRSMWLIDERLLTFEEVSQMMLVFEKSRISTQDLSAYERLIKKADHALKVKKQPCSSFIISSYTLEYNSTPITIIQLPWGVDMAKQCMRSILSHNPNITHIGVVGGVGLMNDMNVEVDDIFIPDSIITTDPIGQYYKKYIQNEFVNLNRNTYYDEKKIAHGSIFSVIPQKQVISNSAVLLESNLPIDAVDMESLGFYEELNMLRPDIRYTSTYYIMDKPFEGIDLGDTYYNSAFLQKLFSNPNRGKYYCMEKILQFLIAD